MAIQFLNLVESNKVVVNVTDQFLTNNNCGFNLQNFRPNFLKDQLADIINDYARSFIGSFCAAIFDFLREDCQLLLGVARFNQNLGFSLTDSDFPEQESDLPIMVPVTQLLDIYEVLTEVNMKSTLCQTGDLKDDLCLIQFRVRSARGVNTLSFINLPYGMVQSDVNAKTLQEVLCKLNQEKRDFLPFNRSIITRLMFDQLSKENILVVSHYTRVAVKKYMSQPRSLFSHSIALGFSTRIVSQRV